MEFESCRREEEPTSTVGIAIRGWKASTTAGYASHLRKLADIEDELGEEGNLPGILSRKLARYVQNGGSSSAARGIISAVRACEDVQPVSGVIKPLHWRLAQAGAQLECTNMQALYCCGILWKKQYPMRNGLLWSWLWYLTYAFYGLRRRQVYV